MESLSKGKRGQKKNKKRMEGNELGLEEKRDAEPSDSSLSVGRNMIELGWGGIEWCKQRRFEKLKIFVIKVAHVTVQ